MSKDITYRIAALDGKVLIDEDGEEMEFPGLTLVELDVESLRIPNLRWTVRLLSLKDEALESLARFRDFCHDRGVQLSLQEYTPTEIRSWGATSSY